jgi:hypothetical protein
MWRQDLPGDDTPLGIPYHRNDPDSHDYINLKLEPERERELPELTKNPILRDVVLAINASTALQTFGCEVWLNTAAKSPWAEYTYEAGSYLDLGFTDARKMDRGTYSQLIDDFVKTKIAKATTMVGFQHKTILAPPAPSLGIIWWNWGFGRTREEAENAWALGIQLFKEFVLERYVSGVDDFTGEAESSSGNG